MNLLVVCQNYYPEQFKINDICEELVKKGDSVTVLTGLPNYPAGKIYPGYENGKKRKECHKGVNIIRSYEIARGTGTMKLGFNYLSYMISATLKLASIKKEFDLIFVYQLSPVTMAFPAILLKMMSKIPVYLYCCDIWPESAKNLLKNEKSLLFKAIKRLSTFLYSKCDRIGITSKPFFEYFTEVHSIPRDRISYLPQHGEEAPLTIKKSVDNGVTDFVFMGNIGIAQDMECILSAVEQLKGIQNFKVHFIGDGSYLQESKNIMKNKGISEYIVFHGRHPLSKMPYFYDLADACLLTLKNENLIGMTMPSKLQGYMAAGKPVIGAISGAAKEVIDDAKCGICVNASDSDGLATAMKNFIEHPKRYSQCGINGRNYFLNHFTIDRFINSLQEQFNQLITTT